MAIYIAIAAALIFSYALYSLSLVGRRPKGYPPGPPTVPIFGNLLQMPTRDAHIQFQKWAHEYGPIYSLILGTKVMIVLNKDWAVKDLLDKRSSIYSSRPDLYLIHTIMSGGMRTLFMPYGAVWRTQRKLTHYALNIKKAVKYIPYQDLENKQLLFDVMQDSSGLLQHFRRYTSSVTASIVFGFRWNSFNNPGLHDLFRIVDEVVEVSATGANAMAGFFPLLRNIPTMLSPVKQRGLRHHEYEKNLYKGYYLRAKHAITNKLPSARACACDDIIELQSQEGFSDDFAGYIAGSILEAGSETTASELYAWAQAMLLYPSAQRTAQAEIDAIVGHARWPEFSDMPNLPYTRSCVKETLRWVPTAALGGVPHSVIQEDEYMRYTIPKDAMIVQNIWAINRDPTRHAHPEKFLPERYMHDDLNALESLSQADVSKRDHFGFGSGRRACPGSHVAERSLWLAIARMLWAFEIGPKVDEKGGSVLPEQDVFVQGMAICPVEFEVRITPRSEEKREFVKKEWEGVREGLDEMGQFRVNPV